MPGAPRACVVFRDPTAVSRLKVSNVFLVAQRRKRIEKTHISLAMDNLQALPIEVDTRTHEQAFRDILEYAMDFGLTVYDAAYLELARRRNIPLATLDKQLNQASKKAGVEVL